MTMNAEKKIRVLIVDDSAFMRKVLEEIISSDPRLEVIGQARDGREAVAMSESMQPDVITMDINMPRMDGMEATTSNHDAASPAHSRRQFRIPRRSIQRVAHARIGCD